LLYLRFSFLPSLDFDFYYLEKTDPDAEGGVRSRSFSFGD